MAKVNVSLSEQFISLGPWGGPGGTEWSCMFDHRGIDGIEIRYGVCVDSLSFITGNDTKKYGGNGGTTAQVTINSPKEYLTNISGTTKNYEGKVIITSLSFYTNLTTNGPYGTASGLAFTIPMKYGKVVGFHGRAGQYIDAIGLYVIPTSQFSKTSQEVTKNEQVVELSKALVPHGPGPWGGPGGKPWDDGVFTSINKILIRQGNNDILQAIQFEYQKSDKRTVKSEWFGGSGVGSINQINVDYPSEYLISVSGFFGPADEGKHGFEAINSLTFNTNKGKYGPFGKEVGTYFASPTGGKIVGFFGRSGAYLDAIGFHMEYF